MDRPVTLSYRGEAIPGGLVPRRCDSVNANRLMSVIVAATALACGCAAVPPERAAVDVRAAAARTPAEHRAVAAEYEALYQRLREM